MTKLKHSKFKNTGILFELLVRQIASDTLAGKDSLALEIIKKHFKKGSELSKELKLYQSLTKETFDSQYKAQEFVIYYFTRTWVVDRDYFEETKIQLN